MIERKGIVVYFKDKKVFDKLDKSVVSVYYVSKKNNYAMIYCDANRYKQVCADLSKMPEVASFEDSLLEVEKNAF